MKNCHNNIDDDDDGQQLLKVANAQIWYFTVAGLLKSLSRVLAIDSVILAAKVCCEYVKIEIMSNNLCLDNTTV
jgi:hypothetical protein